MGLLIPLFAATLEHVPFPMGEAAVVRVGHEILIALNAMHAKNWCHNDLKPSNIFIDWSGRACLGDFGAARVMNADASERTKAYCPSDFDFASATIAGDKLQLAITLLECAGILNVESSETLSLGSIRDMVSTMTHNSPLLYELISELIKNVSSI